MNIPEKIYLTSNDNINGDLEKEMESYFIGMEVQAHENIFEDTFKNIAKHFFELGLKAQKGE